MCRRGRTAPPHSRHLWGDRFVPPVGAGGGLSPVMPLCHLEGSLSVAAIAINSSGLVSTTGTHRKCFLFVSCKHSYRKLSYLGQEAEVTEDRAAQRGFACVCRQSRSAAAPKNCHYLNLLMGSQEPQRAWVRGSRAVRPLA